MIQTHQIPLYLPRLSTANEPSAAFERDGTDVLSVSVRHEKSPIRIIDPAMQSMSEESTPETFHM